MLDKAKLKKLIMVIGSVIILIAIICLVNNSKISKQEIILHISENKDYGDDYVKTLSKYMVENSKVHVFYSKSEIPNIEELNRFIKQKYVESVYTRPKKDGVCENDYIEIALKNPPSGYTGWGIYYQKDNQMKAYANFDLYEECIIDEDHYSYDGRASKYHDRFRYETERICPNWFFYQEEVW